MIYTKRVHTRAIHGSCRDYEREKNEILQQLSDDGVDVDIHEVIDPSAEMPFACTLTWEEPYCVPESIADKFYLKGYKDTCAKCPLFNRTDKRKKTGLCEFFDKEVYRSDLACDHYYLAYVENED